MAEWQAHPIAPVFDEMSRILILGSFPSVKSREAGFFYGHPQNRFWRVLAAVLGCPVPAAFSLMLQSPPSSATAARRCASIKNISRIPPASPQQDSPPPAPPTLHGHSTVWSLYGM